MTTRTRPDQQPDTRRPEADTSGADGPTPGPDVAGPHRVKPTVTEILTGTAPPAAADGHLEQIARQAQDGALRAVRVWTELCTRAPMAVLGAARTAPQQNGGADGTAGDQPEDAPVAWSGRAWSDVGFDLFATALAGQRRLVDQTLSTQRNLVGQLCDTAGGLAAAGARLGRNADGEPART